MYLTSMNAAVCTICSTCSISSYSSCGRLPATICRMHPNSTYPHPAAHATLYTTRYMFFKEGMMVVPYPPHPPARHCLLYFTSLEASLVVARTLRCAVPYDSSNRVNKARRRCLRYLLCFLISLHTTNSHFFGGVILKVCTPPHNLLSFLQSVFQLVTLCRQSSPHNGHHYNEDDTGSRGSKQGKGSTLCVLLALFQKYIKKSGIYWIAHTRTSDFCLPLCHQLLSVVGRRPETLSRIRFFGCADHPAGVAMALCA